jgi:S-formylglutathione hydrolase FrmB
MISRLARFLALTALTAAIVVGVPSAVSAQSTAPAFHSGHGLTIVSQQPDGDRIERVVVSTAALARPVRLNVLLPVGYATSQRRYPVLYLFHGTSGGADDWLTSGDAAAATKRYPMIVVMPDAGYDSNGGSWFTNWVDQHTSLGPANWETFHVDQVIPWIDANLRTVATRAGRAIAGLSQGGFGSFSYAARHPDLFASAGAFSGAPDIDSNPVAKSAATGVISATAVGLDGVQPNAMFGDPVSNDINWQGHNPASLVTNLAHTTLDLWTGNGIPGPLDQPGPGTVPGTAIESVVHQSGIFFTQAADAAHVPHYFDDYGPGTHSWPYWSRDLVWYLPKLMATFTHPPAAPSAVSYKSVEPSWTQWGWTVANRGKSQAWTGLRSASASGFAFDGAGSARITTPAVYRAGARYRVTIGGVPHVVTVGSSRRLVVAVTPTAGHVTVVIKRV